MLSCPICRQRLSLDDGTWRCADGHAFDSAREGYVDLLPVGHGKSGIEGDTREMVRARQRFLDRGFYADLSRTLSSRVEAEAARAIRAEDESRAGSRSATVTSGTGCIIAESGCGTGHWIGSLVRNTPGAEGIGFDVSREALRIAARFNPEVLFVRNDVNHRLCVDDGSIDVLLDIFAPRNAGEFQRVLRPGGLLVVVFAGPDHLIELRRELPMLAVRDDTRAKVTALMAERFRLEWEDAVETTIEVDRSAVIDLVGMTPTAFHLDDQLLESRAKAGRVTVSFLALGFRSDRF